MLRPSARFIVGAAIITIMGLAGAAPAYADSTVVGLWHFDEGSGLSAGDSSGYGNNGTLSGGVSWVGGVGISGSALSFDGLTGSVTVPQSSSLEPAQITVQAWVKRPGSPGSYRYIVDKGYTSCNGGSYGLYSGTSGGLVFYVSANNALSFKTSPDAGTGVWDGNWHLVTGTFDGSTLRLYIDGVQIGSGTPWTTPIGYALQNNNLFFGAYGGCQGFDYPGVIDETEIWNRALSATEIQAQFPYPDLVLTPSTSTVSYGASQTYSATAFDAHANNLGTVTSATTFTIAPDGTCSGSSCTPASVGTHTVTGTDGSVTGTATLNVTPAPVTVTANNVTRPFGAANPSLGATISGFVFGQTLATSGITGAPACITPATPTSPPGTYPITCTQGTLTASNYSFPPANFVPGTLTVTRAATSLAAPPIAVVNSVLALMPTFSATLTSQATGAPIAGQRVAFSFSAAPDSTQCSAKTDSSGVARCTPGPLALVTLLLSSHYTASYAGNTDYLASTTTAPVILLSARANASAALRTLTGRARALLLKDLSRCESIEGKGARAAREAAKYGPRCTSGTAKHRRGTK
jgi:hypothetical protein